MRSKTAPVEREQTPHGTAENGCLPGPFWGRLRVKTGRA